MADVRLGRPRFHQNGVLCTVDRAATIFGWAKGAAARPIPLRLHSFPGLKCIDQAGMGSVRTTRFYTEFQRPEPSPEVLCTRASVRPATLDSAGRN